MANTKKNIKKNSADNEGLAFRAALGHKAAIKDNWKHILQIRETFPGWLPDFEY